MTWDGGSPRIGQIFSDEFARTFGPQRDPEAQLTDRESDLAASLQLRLEQVAFHVLNHLHDATGLTDLGLAGGVAYNSVMNGKILTHTPFRRIFVQPAAGDSGTALGVCYQIWSETKEQGRRANGTAPKMKNTLHLALCPLPLTRGLNFRMKRSDTNSKPQILSIRIFRMMKRRRGRRATLPMA